METNEINILQIIELEGLKTSELRKKNEKQIEVCKKMVLYYQSLIRKNEDEIKKKENEFFALVSSHENDLETNETNCYKQINTPSFKIRYTKEKEAIAIKDIPIEEIPEKFIRVKKEINLRNINTSTTIKNNNVIDNDTGEILVFCDVYKKPGYYKMERNY